MARMMSVDLSMTMTRRRAERSPASTGLSEIIDIDDFMRGNAAHG